MPFHLPQRGRLGPITRFDDERTTFMNPTDVAQSALPLTSADLSIWGLFWSAHSSSRP